MQSEQYVPINSMVAQVHFATYGDIRFERSRTRIVTEARGTGWFDKATAYTPETLSEEYKHSPFWEMRNQRGGGYWTWKFDVIRQELRGMQEGDVLVYADAGCTINPKGAARFRQYLQMASAWEPGIVSFQMPQHPEFKWTTREIIAGVGRNADTPPVLRSGQFHATVMIFRKSAAVVDLIEECWRIITKNPLLITDHYNGAEQTPGFMDNRHDQSILSVMRKVRGCKAIPRDETGSYLWPNNAGLDYPIWGTRRRE